MASQKSGVEDMLSIERSVESKFNRILLGKLTTLALATCLFALTDAQALGSPSLEPELKLYTSRHYATDQTLNDQFTKETGVVVRSVPMKDASALVARVVAEKNNPQADLVITADTGNLLRMAEAGALEPLGSTAVRDVVPENFRDPGDLWNGIAMRVRVIAYSKSRVNPADIKTIESLALPQFKGKILVRTSSHVYNQSLAATLLAASGPEKLRQWAHGIAANLARKPQGGDTDQLKAIGAGEGDIAIVNSYYVARLMDSEDPKDRELASKIGVVFPNQGAGERGAHVNVSGVGLLRGSKAKAAARAYVQFLLSSSSQKLFADASKEYPMRVDVPLSMTLQSWGKPQLDSKALRQIGIHSPAAVAILDEVGWR